jgi:hypothetical protein
LGSDSTDGQNSNIGGGGGGGGTAYYTGKSFTSGQTFSITVGSGGTYSQQNGSNTTISPTTFDSFFVAQGGVAASFTTCDGGNGGNGSGNGGGGGGGGAGSIGGASASGGSGGGGSNSGDPGSSVIGSSAPGGNSYLYNFSSGIIIPFLPTPTTIQFGGGGQGQTDLSTIGNQSGCGASGLGIGGNNVTSQYVFGGNGINNINSGFGGGGGGGSSSISAYTCGGSGGNGVIILWWQV